MYVPVHIITSELSAVVFWQEIKGLLQQDFEKKYRCLICQEKDRCSVVPSSHEVSDGSSAPNVNSCSQWLKSDNLRCHEV